MDDAYLIERLALSGFRAYLEPQTFNFDSKRSLGVFAPNGSGKSSLVDALEFYFSDDGTLKHLGVRAINNQAGISALAHNLAEERVIASSVAVSIRCGSAKLDGVRSTSGDRTRPVAATTVHAACTVDPIIRGYALRRFVEHESAEQRYASVAAWLDLGPLVDAQRNLRGLRQSLKAACDDKTPLARVDAHVARHTERAVIAWDDDAVVTHLNSAVAVLDSTLSFSKLDQRDPVFEILAAREQAEEKQLGLASLKHVQSVLTALVTTPASEQGELPQEATGLIVALESAEVRRADASVVEATERAKAERAVFTHVWEAAQALFADGGPQVGVCPVCETPLGQSVAGSGAAIRDHVSSHLKDLADYRTALTTLDTARDQLRTAKGDLLSGLQGIVGLSAEKQLGTAAANYLSAVKGWTSGPAPSSADLSNRISREVARLNSEIVAIEAYRGNHTYAKVRALADTLLRLGHERALALRERDELRTLCVAIDEQATYINAAIREQIQGLLDTLNVPLNTIYKAIQGPRAVAVRLELPAEDDTNQQRLQLLVDFAANRVGVQPGGYLSDSQIHSLALALRLAAILRFNLRARFVVLDDVVTSYDADHRRAIAALLAEQLANMQVIVTTHDERFFNYLKDQLDQRHWRLARIVRLDPDYGPRFADLKVSDDMIQARWDNGESAANEMRQAEEEWLLGVCRGFGVELRIRDVDKPYSFERSELASALAAFLKDRKLTPPLVEGVNNPFLQSLVAGQIENFGSHFQDAPYGDGSIGDERARWAEFSSFRGLFACPKCRRLRFKRPHLLNKPVCASSGCEALFEFSPQPNVAPTESV